MTVAEAKEAAKSWIAENRGDIKGFAGAYFTGSISSKRDTDLWSPSSDVDFHIFVEGEPPEDYRQRKFRYKGVLIEPLYSTLEGMRTPEQIVGKHYWACHFMADNIICDPTGQLTLIQKGVRDNYRKKKWVLNRCDSVVEQFGGFSKLSEDETKDEIEKLFWFFGCVVCAATLSAVADLRPPTFRKCLVQMRDVASKYDKPDHCEDLIRIIGASETEKETTIEMLQRLIESFNYALQVIKTPFFFDFDCCEEARPVVIDGTEDMIMSGYHREVAWLILAFHNRCLRAFINDGSEENKQRHLVLYRSSSQKLGFVNKRLITQRLERLRKLIPRIYEFSESIIAQNPEIAS